MNNFFRCVEIKGPILNIQWFEIYFKLQVFYLERTLHSMEGNNKTLSQGHSDDKTASEHNTNDNNHGGGAGGYSARREVYDSEVSSR